MKFALSSTVSLMAKCVHKRPDSSQFQFVLRVPEDLLHRDPQSSVSTTIRCMNLRQELTPPSLDAELVARLAELADAIDGKPDETRRSEFNRLAGTDVPMKHFQGVYGSDGHISFVQRLLRKQLIKPVPDVTRDELVEIVRRAIEPGELQEAYMAVFDVNVPRPRASNLIFYPPDYDDRSGTWGGGRQMRDYDPSPEQIVTWALESKSV